MNYPSGMIWPFYPVVLFLVSFSLTWNVRAYALRNKLLDIPNERSSHSLPTPRGGGLAIVLTVLAFLALMYYIDLIMLDILLALGGGGLIVAMVGWMDDHYDISPLLRGFIYLSAAIWTVYFMDGLSSSLPGEYALNLPVYGNLLAVLGLFWLLNLYNFMDGTDAFATVQAICTGIFLGFLFLQSGEKAYADISFAMAAAASGFLYWNWSPAKIFMGDAGSCFIGMIFGSLGILGNNTDSASIPVTFILLVIFICDATLTLLMRIVKRERWYMPHRSHAYQRLVQMGVSHKKLATGLFAINVILLWPTAYIAFIRPQLSWLLVSLVTLLISLLWSYIQFRHSRSYAMGG
jgi:Fuc2NAc and GlcNAc transferase